MHESSRGGETAPALSVELPEGLLDVPFKNDRPRIHRFDAGVMLDVHMRRLARLSGAVDRGLALRLHRLRARRGDLDLGYVSVVAYARERLGLAPRTTQELMKLGRGLEQRPLIDAALREGRITWTAAAEALRGSGRDDEAEWVRLAETSTVRELKDAVRRRREASARAREQADDDGGHQCNGEAGNGEAGNGEALDDDTSRDDAPDDEDPLLRLQVETSGSVARLWDAALELCELVAGVPLRPAEAAEYVLADFLSGTAGAPPEVDDRNTWAVLDKRLRRSRPPGELLPAEELGDLSLPEPYSAEVAAALVLVGDDGHGGGICGDPHEVDASARTLIAARNGVDLDLARLLRNFRSLGLHRHIGFDTFAEYVRERLAISSARAHMLARLDCKLTFLPQTSAAVRCGAIGLVAADQIARVAQPETEHAWIAAARSRTVTRLRKDVEWALREADRSDGSSRWPPSPDALPSALDEVTVGLLGEPMFAQRSDPDATGDAAVDGVAVDGVAVDGAAADGVAADGAGPNDVGPTRPDFGAPGWETEGHEAPAAWIRVSSEDDWLDRLRSDALEGRGVWAGGPAFVPGDNENGLPFDSDSAASLLRRAIDRAFNVAGCPDDAPGLQVGDRVLQMSAPHEASMGNVRVRFELHASALALWNRADWVVMQQQDDGLATDGMVLREVAVSFLLTHLPAWFEALETQDPIALRARFVCQMPGCNIVGGSGHHLRFRSQSGPDEAWNLEFLCFDHHIPGVHGARVRIYGSAPNGLVAELGLRADGRPLERWVRWGPLFWTVGPASHAA